MGKRTVQKKTAGRTITKRPPGPTPAAAEKAFNALDLAHKVRRVLAAPWDKRRDLIMLAHNARELVQALPCEEVYWTVRQTGVQDSLQLISLTSHEQLQFLFDMDCWRKDSLDATALAQWYFLLSKCSELKVMEWFHEADEQFLVASLKKLVRVLKIQQDTDISEEYETMPAATIDGTYFFIFRDKDAYSYVMPLMNALYANDRDLFYSLAEGIIWDTAPESEEAAYAWKSRRLAEYGFPEFDEALKIYHLPADKELRDVSAAIQEASGPGQPARAALQPRCGLSGDTMPRFYLSVLDLIEDSDLHDRFQRETIVLANKILVADSLEVHSAEDTARALGKAAGAIGIALESLSNADCGASLALVSRFHAETLFRAGISLIMNARSEFLNAGWHIQDRSLLASFYGSPRGDALSGIAQSRPLLFEGLVQPGSCQYRAFLSLRELDAVRQAVSICRELDSLLFGCLALDPAFLFSDFLMTTNCQEPRDLTVDALVTTLLARLALTGEARLEPLSGDDVKACIARMFRKKPNGGFALRGSFRTAAQNWLAPYCSGHAPPQLTAYLEELLLRFEETVSPLAGQKNIEKRYVDALLCKR
ncbi:MAG: hypothetical protein JW832_10295 [Deltaproteobacteria bacterium]|nr:hypothetical protein [Deltaproteobacteria bacterium]